MTIDPKAAELAKALADAVAAQQTEEYQELAKAAERKAEIDSAAEKAAYRLKDHYNPALGEANTNTWTYTAPAGATASNCDVHDIFASEPERYELPEDETQTAKPNGGLSD